MTNLPIHITAHHLRPSDSLCRFARKKIAALTRFANDALAADVVLRRHAGAKERFSATARLALPGATFMAVQSAATYMRQSENSWPNLRVCRVSERRGLQKHSSIPDGARLPLN